MQTFIETLFFIGMLINALLFIPQIITVVRNKSSENVSALTFIGFFLIQVVAVMRGYFHQDYIFMLAFGASLITCGTLVIFILIYRFKDWNAK
ncbi:MAG: PQ-loop domain-containing transporter [Bdellovibrionales bacterium]